MTVNSNRGRSTNGKLTVSAVREVVAPLVSSIVDLTCAISRISSPTNSEGARSDFVAGHMETLDLVSVDRDDIGDVVGRIKGRQTGPPLLIVAHLDTVFPDGTSLEITRTNGRVAGAGIGDNSLGVASVLMLPIVFQKLGIVPDVDVLITGNVGEEGLGNLRGVRAVMDANPDVGAVIAVEGHNLGRVTHVAVGSRRLKVTVTGPGGHSWGDYGSPSAIHAAAEMIAELSRLPVPTTPKTTVNVGTFTGGISVNTIAPEASFIVDLRSVDDGALRRLSEKVDAIFRAPRAGISTSIEVLGVRPAGLVSPASRIVRLATQTLESIGISPTGDASSTDANIAIGRGIPAVCIGLTSGGNVHREDEFIESAPLGDGMTQLVLLTLAVASELASGSIAPVGSSSARL
jgi:tripeptide aminopeptidase